MLRRVLLLATFLAGQSAAQGFTSEVVTTFQYEGGKTEQPLVAIGGQPSPNFSFRGDSTGRAFGAALTRYLTEVPDDGATPYALLPFVARLSSATLRLSQSGTGRDSRGLSRGQVVSVESALSTDQTVTAGALEAEWYALPGRTALRGSVDLSKLRSTNVTTNAELPSRRGALGEYGIRSGLVEYGLGVVQRFGPDLAVALDGRYADQSLTRADRVLFTGDTGFRTFDYTLEAAIRGLSASAQALVLARRLLVSASASYDSTTSDLSELAQGPVDSTHRIDRRVRADASWFPTRALGVSAGISYGSSSEYAGLAAQRPVSSGKSVSLTASARWFAGAPLSLLGSFTRTEATAVNPPKTDTFVQLLGVTTRLELGGSVRF